MDDWYGCYKESWKGKIVPEATAHPAKFSRSLIQRIYEHAIENGWLAEGSKILDPFGGVALGALDCMRYGMHWTGVELEGRFQALGTKNIALWNETYSAHFPNWGSARLLQGDSRHLLDLIDQADGVVSSPPFAESNPDGGWQMLGKYAEEGRLTIKQVNGDPTKSYPSWDKDRETPYAVSPDNLGNMKDDGFDAAISSPPYADARIDGNGDEGSSGLRNEDGSFLRGSEGWEKRKEMGKRYGNTEGNLGGLPTDGFDATISSPPFVQAKGGEKGIIVTGYGDGSDKVGDRSYTEHTKGDSPTNLANLSDNGFDATISSPPYAETEVAVDLKSGVDVEERKQKRASGEWEGYNRQNPANLGSLKAEDAVVEAVLEKVIEEQTETFWSAARTIIEQTYAALKPGGVAIWVTKSFVKNKVRVDFPGQWEQMCQAVGFVTVCKHRAWVVEDKGAQYDMFGNLIEKKVEKKSFFRRLAEKRGSPRIDYEQIICMRKSE